MAAPRALRRTRRRRVLPGAGRVDSASESDLCPLPGAKRVFGLRAQCRAQSRGRVGRHLEARTTAPRQSRFERRGDVSGIAADTQLASRSALHSINSTSSRRGPSSARCLQTRVMLSPTRSAFSSRNRSTSSTSHLKSLFRVLRSKAEFDSFETCITHFAHAFVKPFSTLTCVVSVPGRSYGHRLSSRCAGRSKTRWSKASLPCRAMTTRFDALTSSHMGRADVSSPARDRAINSRINRENQSSTPNRPEQRFRTTRGRRRLFP